MPNVVEYEGKTYQLPDDVKDPAEQLKLIQEGEAASENSEPGFPSVSSEQQKERDLLASELRRKEVGGDMKKVSSMIRELERTLKVRPINASVRQMLQRELSFWKTLEENAK